MRTSLLDAYLNALWFLDALHADHAAEQRLEAAVLVKLLVIYQANTFNIN